MIHRMKEWHSIECVHLVFVRRKDIHCVISLTSLSDFNLYLYGAADVQILSLHSFVSDTLQFNCASVVIHFLKTQSVFFRLSLLSLTDILNDIYVYFMYL